MLLCSSFHLMASFVLFFFQLFCLFCVCGKFLDSELNREVTDGNPESETLGSERKTLPSFEGQLLGMLCNWPSFLCLWQGTLPWKHRDIGCSEYISSWLHLQWPVPQAVICTRVYSSFTSTPCSYWSSEGKEQQGDGRRGQVTPGDKAAIWGLSSQENQCSSWGLCSSPLSVRCQVWLIQPSLALSSKPLSWSKFMKNMFLLPTNWFDFLW